jgi:fructose-bisphosphate aldolase, class I
MELNMTGFSTQTPTATTATPAATSVHAFKQLLEQTISLLDLRNKGIHAADESGGNIDKKFEGFGIPKTPENRIAYRGAMITAPGYTETIGGVILFAETLKQEYEENKVVDILRDGGVIIGVKVDSGLVPFNGSRFEKVAKDELDLLPEKLEDYKHYGMRFAKFRVLANIGSEPDGENYPRNYPSNECLRANAVILARYAKICQEHGIVPIVEPEVDMDGNHSIDLCYDATKRFLEATFTALKEADVYMPGIILKTNMVLPGKNGPQVSDELCAQTTLTVLESTIPTDIGSVVFLSGGQSSTDAMNRLKLIRNTLKPEQTPYPISSSFSRALQGPALEAFGNAVKQGLPPELVKTKVQAEFANSLRQNRAALDT